MDTNDMTGAAAAVNSVRENKGPAAPVEGAPRAEAITPAPSAEGTDLFVEKEMKLRKLQKEIEAREAAIRAKEDQYKEDWMPKRDLDKYVPKDELSKYVPKHAFEDDPLGALRDLGLDEAKLTDLLISGHNSQDPTIKAMRAQIRQMAEKQAEWEKQQVESQTASYQQALSQIKNDVQHLVTASPDYEMIKSAGMADAVVELIETTFKQNGTLLDIDDACKQVEDYLAEEAFKLASISKVQNRFKAQNAATSGTPTQQQPASSLKTLTNAVSQERAPGKLTAAERRARAIAVFKGEAV